MGAGFVPIILDKSVLDGTLRVKSEDALAMARRMAKEEGLLVGISGGANICAAIEVKMDEILKKLFSLQIAQKMRAN